MKPNLPDVGGDKVGAAQDGACLRRGDGAEALVIHRHDVVAHTDPPVRCHCAPWRYALHLAEAALFLRASHRQTCKYKNNGQVKRLLPR